MAADIKALRVRIKSVSATRQLTKAMGLVASSKIRKANETMLRSRQYRASLGGVVSVLLSDRECKKSPYIKEASGNREKIVIIAGDRGLAGGYNANVFRLAKNFPQAEFIPIGKRACDRFSAPFKSSEHFSFDDALSLSKSLCDSVLKGEIDRVGVIYTKYNSVMSQEAEYFPLLPITAESVSGECSAVFEPDALTVLNMSVREYVAGMILSLVRESFASEVSARRMAMDSAGKNASQMIDELSLKYNRARQGAITQEITEIVAGSGDI